MFYFATQRQATEGAFAKPKWILNDEYYQKGV